MDLLLCAATVAEIEPTVNWLRARAEGEAGNVLVFGQLRVEVLFTGVGPVATAFALGQRFAAQPLPQLAIQAGVGGALDTKLTLGEVVNVATDRFADLGAEDRDGSLLSLDAIGLPPGPPFAPDGQLAAPPPLAALPFPTVHGLTVARASGSQTTIDRLRHHFPAAQTESMEGAAFLYACLRSGVEPLQLRAISNYVTPRDRTAWRMAEAIRNLNVSLQNLLTAFLP